MKPKTIIFLVRHGETDDNAKDIMQGWKKSRLSGKGRLQAQKLGRELEKGGIDVVVSSPLLRAKQTAKIAFPKRKIFFEKGFRERRYGSHTGKTWGAIARQFPRQFSEYESRLDLDLEGIEPFVAVRKRAVLAMQQIIRKYAGKKIVIIGHGLLNKALLSGLLGWSQEFTAKQQTIGNAGMLKLEFENGEWKLKTE